MLRLSIIALIAGFVSNLGVGVYYFRYIVGNEGLMGVTSAAPSWRCPSCSLCRCSPKSSPSPA